MRQKMTKYALEMVKYAPKIAKYADYTKMHKNTVLCRKMAKYANCIKTMHLQVFAALLNNNGACTRCNNEVNNILIKS